MANKDLEAKMAELKELKNMASELDAEITAIEDDIKAEMTARNTEELICGAFKATWKAVVSHRFDSTAFKKANADLYNLFTKETTSKRFVIA